MGVDNAAMGVDNTPMSKKPALPYSTLRELREWIRPRTTQEDVAAGTGIDQSQVSRIERGLATASVNQVASLAAYFTARSGKTVSPGLVTELILAVRQGAVDPNGSPEAQGQREAA